MNKGSANQDRIVWILTPIQIVHVLDFVVIIPLGPQLMRTFSLSPQQFGYLVSLYTVAAAVSGFLAANWLDLFDRKRSLLWLLLGFLFATAICAVSSSPVPFAIGRALAGVFGGVMGAVSYAIIAQEVPEDRRGRAMGMLGAAFPLVSIAGVPVSLWIAESVGWHSIFWSIVAMGAGVGIWAYVGLPNVIPEQQSGRTGSNLARFFGRYKEILSHSEHRWGLALTLPVVFGGFTIVPYIAPFLVKNGFLLEEGLPWIYLIGGSVTIFTSRWIGILADRFGKIRVFCVVSFAAIFGLLNFTRLEGTVPLLFIFGSTTYLMAVLPGRFICLTAINSILAKPEQRGSFLALYASLQQCAIGAASIVGGALISETSQGRIEGYLNAGIFASCANLVAITLALYIKRKVPRL